MVVIAEETVCPWKGMRLDVVPVDEVGVCVCITEGQVVLTTDVVLIDMCVATAGIVVAMMVGAEDMMVALMVAVGVRVVAVALVVLVIVVPL